MSISVDDLVSSFASNHIGQEAIDLANLQSQLAQALYYQQHQQWTSASAVAPCNTPTARTPSTSFSWAMHENQNRRRSSSTASSSSMQHLSRESSSMNDGIAEEDDGMEADDEYAVEQMVQTMHYSGASSPVRYRHDSLQGSSSSPITLPPHSRAHGRHNSYAEQTSSPMSSSSSEYNHSDPFYAAALAEAAARNAFQPQHGFFAQLARPSQHSPFFAAQAQQSSGLPFSHSVGIDTHSRLAAAPGINA